MNALNALDWVAIVCAFIIFAPAIGHLVYRLLTGPRPAAGEVATAQQIAASPAHPSVRTPGLPVDGRELDADEQRRLDQIVRDSWPQSPHLTPRRPS